MPQLRCWICLAIVLLDQTAWAQKISVTIRVGDRVLIWNGRADVKAEPDADSRTVGVLDEDMLVKVAGISDGWLAIQKPTAGWIAGEHVINHEGLMKAFDASAKMVAMDGPEYAFRGYVHLQFGKEREARADLSEAIRLEPRLLKAYMLRAWLLLNAGEWDQALADCNEGLKLDPAEASLYAMRAASWRHKQEFNRALADLNEAIRLKPTASERYSDRGAVWHDKQEFDKAILDFDEALRLEPDNVGAWHARGWAWQNKDELDKAIANYDRALQLDPEYSISYNNRGLAWHRKGQYDKALADLNEAIRLDPKYVFAYDNRGNARRRKNGDYAGALDDYAKSMELDPNYYSPYNNRAWLRATAARGEFRDGQRAVADATKACQLSAWKVACCLGTLAAAHAELGEFDTAVDLQAKAVELAKPSEKAGYQGRLELYRSRQPYREP